MATESITIQVDAEAAKAFREASAEEQKKMQLLLEVWLKQIAAADTASLKQVMNDIGREAQGRGLTQQELESILEGE
jgi:hypothetical protein